MWNNSSSVFLIYNISSVCLGGKSVFGESLEMLSMIYYGENKSWEIAQKMDAPINRYRALIKKLLDLQFIRFDKNNYSYSLTAHGENVIKFASSRICTPA